MLSPTEALAKEEFNDEEWAVISTINNSTNAVHIDELSWKSQIQISQLANIGTAVHYSAISAVSW